MSVRIRNGKYIVDYYPSGAKGPRKVFTLPAGTTEEEARQIDREVRSRKSRSFPANPSGNIARLVPAYFDYCELHQAPSALYDKRNHFKNHLLPYFGHLCIPELVSGYVTTYKQHMKSKTRIINKESGATAPLLSNRTISKGMCYFSAFLKWAEEELGIHPPQPLKFRKLPSVRPMPTVLSFDEAMRFIDAADRLCPHAGICRGNPKCHFKVAYNVLFKIYFYLGLRNRAGRRLQWSDVNWEKAAVKTVEKGNRVKWHPLPDDLFQELQALHKSSTSTYIFPSPKRSDRPLNDPKKAVKRARTKAGITKRVYPHLLRHSIGTHLIDSDVDIRQIQEFLGHSQISTTEWYTQVSMEKKRQALEKAGIRTTRRLNSNN